MKMTSIYPPHGPQDAARFESLEREEREYSLFCLEFCGSILTRRPSQTEALELAANHFTALGYYADGLLLDQRLAVLKPSDPGVLYNLGCSLALTGRRDEAFLALNQAVTNGYADHQHMSADADLQTLKNDTRFETLLERIRRGLG